MFTSNLGHKIKYGGVNLWFLNVFLRTRVPNNMADSITLIEQCKQLTRKVPHNHEDFSENCVHIKAAISTYSRSKGPKIFWAEVGCSLYPDVYEKWKVSNIQIVYCWFWAMYIKRTSNSACCTTDTWHIEIALIVKIFRN